MAIEIKADTKIYSLSDIGEETMNYLKESLSSSSYCSTYIKASVATGGSLTPSITFFIIKERIRARRGSQKNVTIQPSSSSFYSSDNLKFYHRKLRVDAIRSEVGEEEAIVYRYAFNNSEISIPTATTGLLSLSATSFYHTMRYLDTEIFKLSKLDCDRIKKYFPILWEQMGRGI